MFEALQKWQATFLVALAIVALVVLAIAADAPADLVVGALAGIPGLVLGAGAVAHGVRQGARSTAEAIEIERAEEHRRA